MQFCQETGSRSEPICKTYCKGKEESFRAYTAEWKVLDPMWIMNVLKSVGSKILQSQQVMQAIA